MIQLSVLQRLGPGNLDQLYCVKNDIVLVLLSCLLRNHKQILHFYLSLDSSSTAASWEGFNTLYNFKTELLELENGREG